MVTDGAFVVTATRWATRLACPKVGLPELETVDGAAAFAVADALKEFVDAVEAAFFARLEVVVGFLEDCCWG